MTDADENDTDDDGGGEQQHWWTWTPGQRRLIAGLLIVLCVVFAIRYTKSPAYVPDPPPEKGPRYHEVADRIDPNTADVSTLSALPMLGEARARDIVEYRDRRVARFPDQRAFNSADDLLRIKGFGSATVETLRPYLMFPTTAPTTQR